MDRDPRAHSRFPRHSLRAQPARRPTRDAAPPLRVAYRCITSTHIALASHPVPIPGAKDLLTPPYTGRPACTVSATRYERKERLQLLMMRFIIGSLKPSDPLRAALVVQKAWA